MKEEIKINDESFNTTKLADALTEVKRFALALYQDNRFHFGADDLGGFLDTCRAAETFYKLASKQEAGHQEEHTDRSDSEKTAEELMKGIAHSDTPAEIASLWNRLMAVAMVPLHVHRL